jgi:multicomponent Na+:H+ antiporter subunit G
MMVASLPTAVLATQAPTVGPLRAALVTALLAVGVAFLLIGTLGLLRLPNVYNRMHATTKATTLGAASVALAAWVFYGPGGKGLIALITVVFLFLTAPTGAHHISRAAHRMGVAFEPGVDWPGDDDPPGEQRED